MTEFSYGVLFGFMLGVGLTWFIADWWSRRDWRLKKTRKPGPKKNAEMTGTTLHLIDHDGLNALHIRTQLAPRQLCKLIAYAKTRQPLTYRAMDNIGITRAELRHCLPVFEGRGAITYGRRGEAVPTLKLVNILLEELP